MTPKHAAISPVRESHLLPVSLLFIFIALSTAPGLKIGDVQVLELVQALRVLVVLCFFLACGLRIPGSGVWRRYAVPYCLFLAACLVLALVSLRLAFYPPPDVSFLKYPFVVSLSRLFELAIAVYFMTAVADTLSLRPRLIPLSLDVFGFVGAFSALVSVISFLLSTMAGISLVFVYSADHRVRGFFNEGGPYGLFLVSVILLLVLRLRLFPPRHRSLYFGAVGLSLLTLFLSQSRAALVALVALYGVSVIASHGRRRLILLAVLPVLCVTSLLLLRARFNSYNSLYSNFEQALFFHSDDPNLVMGRISAALIVPRMLASHPVLGIGIGNYSLMRNDPDYLQGLPSADKWDLPGLGLLGSTAEFGIPLTIFFFVLLVKPLWQGTRKRVRLIVVLTAAFQPLATLFGVNLNFFYPWLVTGLILPLIPSKPDLKKYDAK
jgi:O-Antigen ligase